MNTLRDKGVAAKLGITPSTVWKLAKTEGFPRPFKLAPRITVWDEGEIDKWLILKKEMCNGHKELG